MSFLASKALQTFGLCLEVRHTILPEGFNIIQSLGVPRVSFNKTPPHKCSNETDLVASKISSNFFFNAAGSDKGQYESSW